MPLEVFPERDTSTGLVRETISAAGATAGQTAGSAIITLAAASLPAGVYLVRVGVVFYGSLASAQAANIRLLRGATPLHTILVPPNPSAAARADLSPLTEFVVKLDGTQTLSVVPIANDSPSTVAVIYADKIG